MAKKTKNPDGSEQNSKAYRFRVREGSHFDEKGREYVKGDEIDSDFNLSEAFKNKFDVLKAPDSDEEPLSPDVHTDTPSPNAPRTPAETPVASPSKPKGSDVTARFKDAKDQDFVVYQDGNGFTVYDKDDMSKPVNDKPVAEKDVPKVISDALKK